MINREQTIKNEQDVIFLERTGQTLDQLYRKYYPKLKYNLREKLNGNDELAEEFTSNAFFTAMNKIDQYDRTRAEFSTWLFKIAHNLFLIDLKVKKSENTISMDVETDSEGTTIKDFLGTTRDEIEEVDIQNINTLKAKILVENLSKLKPDYAEVIRLRDIEEYSYNNIAEKLDINLNTLKSRIRNARKELIEISKDAFDKLDNLLF